VPVSQGQPLAEMIRQIDVSEVYYWQRQAVGGLKIEAGTVEGA